MSATTSARAYLDTTVTSEPSERQDTTAGGNGRGCSGLSAASRQSSIQHCTCTGASPGVNVLYWSGPSVRVGTGASFWGSGVIPIGSASGACLEERSASGTLGSRSVSPTPHPSVPPPPTPPPDSLMLSGWSSLHFTISCSMLHDTLIFSVQPLVHARPPSQWGKHGSPGYEPKNSSVPKRLRELPKSTIVQAGSCSY